MVSWRRGFCLALLLCATASATPPRNTHTSLHGERTPVVVSEGRQRSTDGNTYFLVQSFGDGFVNAQLSVLKGFEAAKRHDYIFVVPPIVQWWAEHEPSYLLMLPFHLFFDERHFDAFAKDYGVDIVWELPPDRTPACMLQQQLSKEAPHAVNKGTHKAWAQEYGVICLSGTATFYTIDGADQPMFWPPDNLRQALKPSGLYATEVHRMLEEVQARFGTSEFVGVHLRLEPDWESHCAANADRSAKDSAFWNDRHQCWVDEAQTARILEHKLRVEPGSLLFIQARVPLKKLPTLCSLYRCFDRETVWVNRSPEIPYKKTSLVLSYLTSLLAEHASALYGDAHSGYYGELAKKFSAADKPAQHLNPDCPAQGPCP